MSAHNKTAGLVEGHGLDLARSAPGGVSREPLQEHASSPDRERNSESARPGSQNLDSDQPNPYSIGRYLREGLDGRMPLPNCKAPWFQPLVEERLPMVSTLRQAADFVRAKRVLAMSNYTDDRAGVLRECSYVRELMNLEANLMEIVSKLELTLNAMDKGMVRP